MTSPAREYDRRRGSAAKRGYNREWDRKRRAFLEAHPMCAMRGPNCTLIATHVDHIIPHNGDKRLMWDRSNWQSLCHACHNLKTAQERSGKANRGCDINGNPLDPNHPWNR